ncbi:MAG: hypothetical protein J6A23_13470 [Thermoguttaceae bacterium]|nr:hypothetical protein [Thermoguttaceae bacterium]
MLKKMRFPYVSFFASLLLLLLLGRTVMAGVFDGVPKYVALPDCTKESTVKLFPLATGEKAVTVELLGGEIAIPQKGTKKKKKSDPDAQTPPPAEFYSLEEGKAKDPKLTVWNIKFNQRGRKATCATIALDGESVKFKWRTKVPQKFLLPVGNCALKLTCGEEKHYIALREPVQMESILLNPKTGSGSIKSQKMEIPFPSPDAMFLEVQNLGKFKPGDPSVTFPPVTRLSDISPREPLQINFTFTDPNGNAAQLFYFDVLVAYKTNFSASLIPPKELARDFGQLLQTASDPQVDIQITNMQKKIQSIKKKLDEQEAWRRNAKDTQEIAILQQQISMIEKLRSIHEADAKVRLFIDYGEAQADIILTETLTVEQREEAKQSKRKGGKQTEKEAGNADADEEEAEDGENGFEGMKF